MEFSDDPNIPCLPQKGLVVRVWDFQLFLGQVVNVDLVLHLALGVDRVNHRSIFLSLIRVSLDRHISF